MFRYTKLTVQLIPVTYNKPTINSLIIGQVELGKHINT
jgi:hypothetical protein